MDSVVVGSKGNKKLKESIAQSEAVHLQKELIPELVSGLKVRKTVFKETGSAVTHLIGMVLTIVGGTLIIPKAVASGSVLKTVTSIVFIVSMFMLYTASTAHHTFDISARSNLILKKLDHAMIFVLIAGTYTPVCLLALGGVLGIGMLTLVWSFAVLGIAFKMLWVGCPKWLSSAIYIMMGWLVVMAFGPLMSNLNPAAFGWLLGGGIVYTIGGVAYAIIGKKIKLFNDRHRNFGMHEIFHVMVIIGSFCHFVMIYGYLI